MELGPFVDERCQVLALWPPMSQDNQTTWLTNRTENLAELVNLAE